MPVVFNPFTGNLEFQKAGGSGPVTGAFVQGGNSFGSIGNLGTNDSFPLNIRTNGITALSIDITQNLSVPIGGFSVGNITSGFFVDKTGVLQINGSFVTALPIDGLELGNFTGESLIQANNRSTSTFRNLRIRGLNLFFVSGVGVTALTIDTTQKATFANIIEGTQLNFTAGGSKIALDVVAGIVLRAGQGFTQFNIGPDTITLNSIGSGTSISCTNQISFNRGAISNASANTAYQFFNATYSGTGSLIVMNPTGNIDVSAGTPTIIFYNASPSFTNLNAGSNFYAYFSNVPAVVPLGGSTWSHFANGTAPNAYNGFSKFGGLTVPLAIVDIATGTTTNAPLKLTSGTLTTGINIRPGQVEFLNDEYFITGTTLSTRKVINDLVRFNTSGNITLDGSNEFVVFTAGTNNATLPTAVGFNKPYTISNIGTGVITILTTGGQTINGLPSGSFSLIQFDTIFLRSDGTNWIKLN